MLSRLMPREGNFFALFILWAWILTIPCSAFIAGVAWYPRRLLLAPAQ